MRRSTVSRSTMAMPTRKAMTHHDKITVVERLMPITSMRSGHSSTSKAISLLGPNTSVTPLAANS